MPDSIQRPNTDEFAPYYGIYIQRVPDGDIFETLKTQLADYQELLNPLSDNDGSYKYAPDQWSIKEVIGHICDAERIFVYRATAFARNDQSAQPGFDQDDYVSEANYDQYMLADLCNLFGALRQATFLTFSTLSDEVSQRRGTQSDVTMSVRALLYTLAGHADMHLESLRTEYIPGLKGEVLQSTSEVAPG